jgi:beta-lactamase class A
MHNVPPESIPGHTYAMKSNLQFGQAYTIKQLLEEMVINSDNAATRLLNYMLEKKGFNEIFSDLEMDVPNMQDLNYSVSAKQYSSFFRLLFNATYLSKQNSEYALGVLSKSSFKDGIAKKLPQDVIAPRKFGEFSTVKGLKQIHESAIVYCCSEPYLITVMSKGKNIQEQTDLIAEISSTVYKFHAH